ncbi:MAG: hypothetical protein AAB676_05795 [Verrucomicrobiota bacterium]
MRAGFIIFLLLLGPGVEAAPPWDTFSDAWVATDALGRSVPTPAEVGPPRPGKYAGIFYFLWLGQHGEQGPFDITKILAADADTMLKPDSPLWGPLHAPHHWGESIFGYYVSEDEGVIRKHAQMLADAGVDVVIFDVTNQLTYPGSWRALCRAFDDVRRHGGRTPQIAFLCPFSDPAKVVRELWRDLYEPGHCRDLWFPWDGKPLILADPDRMKARETPEKRNLADERDARIREFFTFRKPQPDYFQGPTQPDMWSWLEVHPQHVFRNARGEKEQMSVGVAQNAVGGRLGSMSEPGARGRSFHRGAADGRPGAVQHGFNVAEQWEHALREDPRFIFVTGWNEWIAGRFAEFNRVKLPVMFVDQFDQEHSRDIEPMKGGHGDNYYYQMVASIRRFKGARPLPPVVSRPVQIDGRFDDWSQVEPEFRDSVGDPARRDHRGWGKDIRYTNHTGRNDLVAAKVSADAGRVCFYVRTHEPLTPPTGPNWMLLFVNADGNATNGWLGYDFVVNRRGVEAETTWLERHESAGYHWGAPLRVSYRAHGNELELALPRAALGLSSGPVTLDFKWADNLQQTGDWSDFTLNGDAAPNDRFNFRATFAVGKAAPETK